MLQDFAAEHFIVYISWIDPSNVMATLETPCQELKEYWQMHSYMKASVFEFCPKVLECLWLDIKELSVILRCSEMPLTG